MIALAEFRQGTITPPEAAEANMLVPECAIREACFTAAHDMARALLFPGACFTAAHTIAPALLFPDVYAMYLAQEAEGVAFLDRFNKIVRESPGF